MTPRERMLTALDMGKPDRLPGTIHQFQPYYLEKHLGGISDIEAFEKFDMDAAIMCWPLDRAVLTGPDWQVESKVLQETPNKVIQHTITTPDGLLSYSTEQIPETTYIKEHLVKRPEDIYLVEKYMPIPKLDIETVKKAKERLGDGGILRGTLPYHQGGVWQDACELFGTENMIMAGMDDPDWVGEFMKILMEKKLRFVEEEMKDAPYDLVENGGGAASTTVISPKFFEDFTVPYDKQVHDALHEKGYKVVYHTCGGMIPICELIVKNGCDAAETLAPSGVGGDVDEPSVVKEKIGDKVCLIGGLDQFNILTNGTPDKIRKEVFRLFEQAGQGGGYIVSAADHFFETPPENLQAYADAIKECTY